MMPMEAMASTITTITMVKDTKSLLLPTMSQLPHTPHQLLPTPHQLHPTHHLSLLIMLKMTENTI